mmetsp:Transcript_122746/g.192679  ORF Transcript_122746/g.192679 Transcript_122746/m.192679 type:complete len:278 (-) Transcript_122746:81-914(-)|eukprot:CAMPEP_0169085560 /NCGR_PEP_ID=MMETSP1015-20121227/13232_1 /TAXON_ID=342587 /ORGANISM="Karlodinium micrum, Strain CCMP2283" /LENGTH=277 /DNA_ID=CAMNT_0009145669 /DNA_START=48 /DNA_END=881 /DNA_ORIENTATION=+
MMMPTGAFPPSPYNLAMEHHHQMYGEEYGGQLLHERKKTEKEIEEHMLQTHREPLDKARTFMQHFTVHTGIVQSLVEEPMFAQPKFGEPVLEVKIVGAELHGPWPHPLLNFLQRPFVRHYIDNEMVGQTRPWREDRDPRMPKWHERMLVFPRGARCSQFEILNDTPHPLVLGDCAFSTETLWQCSRRCGKYSIGSPILYKGYQVGTLMLQFGPWDGLPLDEDLSTLPALEGTLAGALDNPFMREFGPEGYRSFEGNPFAVKPFMTNFLANPMMSGTM